jgi:hypothetical protein
MKNISFALTTTQFLRGTKDVTRRLGWKNLKPGTRLMGCKKCMGLKPGEKLERLGAIEIVSVRREPLNSIEMYPPSAREVEREGFPGMSADRFIEMFCQHMGCTPETEITRIEFKRV